MIVTLKYGEVNDIHPRNKKPVGEASALAAAARISKSEPYQAPAVQYCTRKGNTLFVTFDSVIMVEDNNSPCTLVIAGNDGIFYPAQGKIINGTTLEISSAEVIEPSRVRYAWSDNPLMANLCGSNGLPVSPFEASIKR